MALLFCDGFEVDFPNDNIGIWTSKTEAGGASLEYQDSEVRFGQGASRWQSGSVATDYIYLTKNLPQTYTEVYFSFQLYITSFSNGGSGFIKGGAIFALGDTQVGFQRVNPRVWTAATPQMWTLSSGFVLVGDGINTMAVDEWLRIEGYLLSDPAAGAFKLIANGVTEIDVSGTQTTKGAGGFDTIKLGWIPHNGGSPAGDIYIDDFAVWDDSGSIMNTYQGDIRISAVVPDGEGYYTAAGGGSANAWNASTGGNYYDQMGGELTAFGAPNETTYVSDVTVTDGARVSTTTEALALSSAILGVQHHFNVKTDSLLDRVEPFFRISSADYDSGQEFSPGAGFGWKTYLQETNPATASQWTAAQIDAAEFGLIAQTG
jgi:hypothetical protein